MSRRAELPRRTAPPCAAAEVYLSERPAGADRAGRFHHPHAAHGGVGRLRPGRHHLLPHLLPLDGRGELALVFPGRLQRFPHARRTPEPAAGAHRVQLPELPHIWRALASSNPAWSAWAASRSRCGIVFWTPTARSNWPAGAKRGSGVATRPARARRCAARRCPKPCGCGWPAEYGPHACHCVCFAAPRGGRSQLGAARRWLIRELFCRPRPWPSSCWRA
jgi:hypothetical protein